MGTVSWSKEESINDSIDRYDNKDISKDEFRGEIMDLADNNLEFIEICDHAGAL